MNLADLKGVVILLALVALIAAATAIALDEFQDETTSGTSAYNITENGLTGVDNSTDFLDTIGTIAGVAVLIGLVVLAFQFGKR